MQTDQSHNADKFEKMLTNALHEHKEPIRPGFTDKVLTKIDALEQQRILKAIVLRERISLTACIVISFAMVGCILAFSKVIMANLSQLAQGLNSTIAQAETGIQQNWQIYLVVIGVIGFMVYSSYDLFFAKNTR
jgi:hypothetical protein